MRVYEHEEAWALHVSIFMMHNKGLLILHTITCTNPFLNVSFHSNPKERNAKECSNYLTIVLISHASKVMLKIL